MATWLLVDTSDVIRNVIEWDGTSPYTPPAGETPVQYDGAAGIGWTWDGTTATDPNPPPPAPVAVPAPVLYPQATDDAAAAALSPPVPVGGLYCNGSQVMQRQS